MCTRLLIKKRINDIFVINVKVLFENVIIKKINLIKRREVNNVN